MDYDKLKELWREQYEQWRRPGEPPWEEIEARVLEGMKQHYAELEQQSKARLVDDHAEIERCRQIQRLLSGEDVGAVALVDPTSNIVYEIFSNVQAKAVPWLWPGRIPRGMLILLVGDPGEGKSYLSLAIMASLSRGGKWPDGSGEAPICTSGLLNLEDAREYVIRPRLDQLGADLTRIARLTGVGKEGAPLDLRAHAPQVKSFIQAQGLSLLTIDPVNSFFPLGVDSFRDVDVRHVLTPLARIAEETSCTILAIMHLTKAREDRRAIHRIMGSVGFSGVPRVIHGVAEDAECRRLFGMLKSNICEFPPCLSFRVHKTGFSWGEVLHKDIREVLEGTEGASTRQEEACQFIEEVLPIGTKMETAELDRQAKQRGFTGGTWARAKKRMGVKCERLPDVRPPMYVSYRE